MRLRDRAREGWERDREKVICVLSWIEIVIDKEIASDKALYMDELKEKEIEIYIEKAINKEIETDKEMERWWGQRNREREKSSKKKNINWTE